MKSLTPEDATQERIDMLGVDKGHFFRNLENDLYSMRILWKKYVAFFSTNENRVKLLNSISGGTAYWIERSLFEASILNICRMTDSKSSGRNGGLNLTIQALPDLLTNGPDEQLAQLITIAKSRTEFARSWRNKRIAHTDKDIRLGTAKLEAASRKNVRTAIDSIAESIKRFAEIEMNTTLVTHPISPIANDEVELLEVIYLGKVEFDRRETEKARLLKERDYSSIAELEAFPNWVSYRPDDELDI